MPENLKKISIIIKNVIEAEDSMVHSTKRPSNCFFPTLSHIIRLSRYKNE